MGSEVSFPLLGPDNRTIADINTAYGTTFEDWDHFQYRPSFTALVPVTEYGQARFGLGGSLYPARLKQAQAAGPGNVGLDWRSWNLLARAGYQHEVVHGTVPLYLGAEGLMLWIMSDVKAGVPGVAATATDWANGTWGYGAFLGTQVKLVGRPVQVEFGYRLLHGQGTASGTAILGGVPGPFEVHAPTDFSGPYFEVRTTIF